MLESLIDAHRIAASLAILIVMLVAFAREWLPPSGVGAVGAAAFVALGFVEESALLEVFSNPAAIAIGAMLVLSAALVRTGTLEALAGRTLDLAKSRPVTAVVLVLGVAFAASAFVNSTPVVVILIPLMAALAKALGTSPKKLLIPLSYIAILGGTCTLIGTSTNLLVNSIAREQGLAGFGIFDITVVGLCAAAAGTLFLWASGRFLLPSGGTARPGDPHASEAVDILTECRVLEGFAGLGKPWSKASFLGHRGVRLVQLIRGGRRIDTEEAIVAERDRLVLRVTSPELASLDELDGLDVGLRLRKLPDGGEERQLARLTVTSDSDTAGKRLGEAHFLSRHPIAVVGVRRRRNLAGPDLSGLTVKSGDQLWLRGSAGALAGVASDDSLVFSAMPVAKPFLRDRAAAAVTTLALVIGAATFGIASLPVAAIIGIGFLLAIRSLDTGDAWSALNADVLILIYAMLVVGAGLQETGTVDAVIGAVAPTLDALPPIGVVLALYFLTSVLTETVTNNAVAVIMTPLAIGLATRLGLDPTLLVVTVMFAASASFATPVGYQTNTLVHAAGNYRFAEFVKIGVPMNIVVGIVTCLAIEWWFG